MDAGAYCPGCDVACLQKVARTECKYDDREMQPYLRRRDASSKVISPMGQRQEGSWDTRRSEGAASHSMPRIAPSWPNSALWPLTRTIWGERRRRRPRLQLMRPSGGPGLFHEHGLRHSISEEPQKRSPATGGRSFSGEGLPGSTGLHAPLLVWLYPGLSARPVSSASQIAAKSSFAARRGSLCAKADIPLQRQMRDASADLQA